MARIGHTRNQSLRKAGRAVKASTRLSRTSNSAAKKTGNARRTKKEDNESLSSLEGSTQSPRAARAAARETAKEKMSRKVTFSNISVETAAASKEAQQEADGPEVAHVEGRNVTVPARESEPPASSEVQAPASGENTTSLDEHGPELSDPFILPLPIKEEDVCDQRESTPEDDSYEPPAEFKSFPSKKYRHVNDNVHERLYIFQPVNAVVDTPEFQRLRRLKQTGLTHLVYPNSEHSRFSHSLGVYCFALDFVRKLAEKQPELGITSRDILCVALAGLCHDLGHGPFSHTYEHLASKDFKHEAMSTRIFRRIMKKSHVREAFYDYLNFNEDIDFVCELINPPKEFVVNGRWVLTGRPIEKSFLYGFISNVHDSFDVDKYDYLLRDAKGSGPYVVNPYSITRIQDNMRVLFDRELGFQRIAYSEKVRLDLESVANTRMKLHESHYQHQTVRACEYMLQKALKLVGSYLTFRGKNDTMYCLETCHRDVEAFLRTNDAVYSSFQHLNHNLDIVKEAEAILEQLECRQMPHLVTETHVKENVTKDNFVEYLNKKLENKLSSAQMQQFCVMVKEPHCGMGLGTHPLEKVLFYDHKAAEEPTEGHAVDETWKKQFLRNTGHRTFLIYSLFEASDELRDIVFEATVQCAEKFKSSKPSPRSPTKRRPSPENDATETPMQKRPNTRACRKVLATNG